MNKLLIPLDISSLEIVSQSVDNKDNIILTVESTKAGCKCHRCGKTATKRYGHAATIEVRHQGKRVKIQVTRWDFKNNYLSS